MALVHRLQLLTEALGGVGVGLVEFVDDVLVFGLLEVSQLLL